MEDDFATFCKNQKKLQTNLIAKPEPKQGFIAARMNKDNFWNLMFACGIIAGSLTVGAIPSLIIMAIILRKFNKVTFTSEKTFLNSQEQDITMRIPKNLFWSIALTIGATLIIGGIFDKYAKNLSHEISTLLIFFTLFSSFTSYFIYINCPISVLFNLDVWKQKRDLNTSYQHLHKSPFNSSHDDSYSPSKSYLPSNCYHRS